MKKNTPPFMIKQKQRQQQQQNSAMAEKYMQQPLVKCANPECDSELFVPCAQIHKISMLVSNSGQTEYFPVQRSACLKCHTLLPFKP